MDNYYKEKYENLIRQLKKAEEEYGGDTFSSVINKIIPELKESEDERIRKALIDYFRWNPNSQLLNEFTNREVFAWLKKQGNHNEQNFWKKCNHCEYFDGYDICLHKKNFGSVTNESKENCRNNGFFIEKQVEQKPADKVEPKFKVGDWVVQDNIGVFKIIEICKSWYEVIDFEDNHYSISFDNEHMCHLWTIQDAKDSNVLYSPCCKLLWIYKDEKTCHVGSKLNYNSCSIVINKSVCIPTDVQPATKEQRDLLFQKMHETGYEWDAEKKELKKIEQICYHNDGLYYAIDILEKTLGKVEGYQSDDGIIEHQKAIETVNSLYYKKPAEWNEEDSEWYMVVKESILERWKGTDNKDLIEIRNDALEWLKSIKDRILPQPKQEWSEKDEDIKEDIIEELELVKKSVGEINYNGYDKLIDWLKSLKPNHWKPSEYDISLLEEIARNIRNNVRPFCSEVSSLEDLIKNLKTL